MPEAVAQHDVVVVLPELCDVATGPTEEACRIEQPAAGRTFPLLSPFTPLAPVVDSFVDPEPDLGESLFDVAWPETVRPEPGVERVRLGITHLGPRQNEVHEAAAAGAEHAMEL